MVQKFANHSLKFANHSLKLCNAHLNVFSLLLIIVVI